MVFGRACVEWDVSDYTGQSATIAIMEQARVLCDVPERAEQTVKALNAVREAADDLITSSVGEVRSDADEFYGNDPSRVLVRKCDFDALEAALVAVEKLTPGA